MDICTFWYGPRLREVDRLCLASMVMTGQHVKLFTYAPIENVPAGVKLHDASTILPELAFKRLDPGYPTFRSPRTIVQFSDIFRIMLMKHQQGVWLDTDVFLLKQFHPDPEKPYLARENRSRVGVSALYFPPDHPIIGEFEAYMSATYSLPQWLGIRRGTLRPLYYRAIGKEVTPASIGITVFGNDGISRLARKYGIFRNAASRENFYYWIGKDAARIYDPAYGLEPIHHAAFIGFHIHQKHEAVVSLQSGSLYTWMWNRVRPLLGPGNVSSPAQPLAVAISETEQLK
ncbi:capsular polysaccharide synthesis protein [Brucella intermedia]|uniref:capsular polysaccharide synthesis protein n=1 Tax=Brucella intermedia TaxID=94625 RepID=UPI001FFF2A14|nr:capsular polysaccharide synthesis protein [Brucella intermedia]